MATLLILNHQPYDGTDVTWNALRLARQLHSEGVKVRIFLMNDSVDDQRIDCERSTSKSVRHMPAEVWGTQRSKLLRWCAIFHYGGVFTVGTE